MAQHVGKIKGHLPPKFVGRLTIDCRPTVGRPIAKPTVGRQFFHFLKTEKCWPTNDRQSVNCSVTCRQSVGNCQVTKHALISFLHVRSSEFVVFL